MRLTHWRPGPGLPLRALATTAESVPVYVGGGRETFELLAESLYGVGHNAAQQNSAARNRAEQNGSEESGREQSGPEQTGAGEATLTDPGAAIDGEIVIEQGVQLVRARPGQAAVLGVTAERLIIDAGHPEPEWGWLSAPATDGAGPGRPPAGRGHDRAEARSDDDEHLVGARLVQGWLRALVDGRAGSPAVEKLRRELADTERLLAEAEARDRAGLFGAGATDVPPAGPVRSHDGHTAAAPGRPTGLVELPDAVRSEVAEFSTGFAELRAEMQDVDADLDAIERTLRETAEDTLRIGHEIPDTLPPPSLAELNRLSDVLSELRRAVTEREQAVTEAIAAGNTAAVMRHGVAQASRPRWLGKLQPGLLGLSAALVIMAVVLLTREKNGLGITAGLAALVAATVAFVLPGRPARALPDAEVLGARATRAERESSTWQDEAQRRSAEVTRLAGALDLSPEPTETELARVSEQIAAWRALRERTDGLARATAVATNTTTAAKDRRSDLMAKRREVERRQSELEASWLAWGQRQGVSASLTPDDLAAGRWSDDGHEADRGREADEGLEAEATGLRVELDPLELRQARQGLLDQLGRLYWEADRLALASWLLHRQPPSAKGGPTSTGSKASENGTVASIDDVAGLRRRAGQLLSALVDRSITVSTDRGGRPQLSDAEGRTQLLDDVDGETYALVGMCLRIAAAEQAAGGEWPVLVRAPGTTTPLHAATPLAVLLSELAHHTQVLVITDAALEDAPDQTASDASGRRPTDGNGQSAAKSSASADGESVPAGIKDDIRVLVTPTE
jgi:hypothetical protein